MKFTTAELGWLLEQMRPGWDAAAVARVELAVIQLGGGMSGFSRRLDALSDKIDALSGQEQQEITILATTDEQIATIGADVQQVITLYSALKSDDENEAAQLAAMRQALADAQAADGADSPRAKALQAIVDALTPILTPAAPAPDPAPAPAPAGGDTTGGTGATGGTDTTGGGDQTPVPVDGGAGDVSAPAPSDPTA